MPYGEVEAEALGHGEKLTSEPCYKRLKPTEGAYTVSHHGAADFHRPQEQPGRGWAHVASVDFRGSSHPPEDSRRTTDEPKAVCGVKPGSQPCAPECTGPQLPTDDGIYSTSKAFIGPIYQPPERKKGHERRNPADVSRAVNGKGGREEPPTAKPQKSEIDNELFQFYKEIEELEKETDELGSSCPVPSPCPAPLPPYYQAHPNGLFRVDEGTLSDALQAQAGYQEYLVNDPGRYPCGGQIVPPFCGLPFAPFRPEWRAMPPFVPPPCPPPPILPPPSFSYHLNIQRFQPPPKPPPHLFQVQENSQPRNESYGNTCSVNWGALPPDQSSKYTDCHDTSSSLRPCGSDLSVQDGRVHNGFCEIRQECWGGGSGNQCHTLGVFMNQQSQEEKLQKLQKLLILLRGLPGSGKTTLSRILLGQSRDGIVFSTDDYFRHQDGYRYNVTQLGDAHDWNQNRAKQAIAQGRSPVIIDNTNTQAWEMKPYVEMAVGKGYRVEFHEPETWWKFDPEELEKRNKHGVSRKKIAQMLERYESHMSIAVVLNSVEPSHKSALRPPPPECRPRERDLKEIQPGLRKPKQKRNRKRNKTKTRCSEILERNMYEHFSCLSSGAPELTLREGGDLDETQTEPRPTFAEHVESSKDKRCKNLYPEENFPKVTSVTELYNTPKNRPPTEGGNLLLSLSSVPNRSAVNLQAHNLPCVTCDDRSGLKEDKHGEHMRAVALDVQGGVVGGPRSFMRKTETVGKSLLYHQLGRKTSHQVLTEELGGCKTQTNDWAFFSIHLSDEELQLGSVGQPYSGSWPEGPHTLICEQRLKKDRWRRQTCARGSGDLVKLISTSKGTSGPGNSPEPSLEEKLVIEDENLPSSVEIISSCLETSILRNHLPALGSPQGALVSTNNKKRRQIRISNLTPNFDLWGQANTVKVTGEGVPLTESHGLKMILGAEKDRLSKINNDKKKMEQLRTFSHHPFWVYLDIIKDSPLETGRHLSSHCLSFNRLKYSVYFSHNPIPSLRLQCRSSFWTVSFSSKKPLLTFRSHTRVDSKQDGVGLISSEVSSHQLDTLYAFKVASERHFVRERLGEKLTRGEESFQYLQTEDNQDLRKTRVNPLGLLQSQEFACQLVELFQSPRIPIGSLLPADLVVPLDWQTLRTICLQWRAAVKKRQKTALGK